MANTATITSMDELVQQEGVDLVPFKAGTVIEAEIISASRNKILVDLGGLTIGMVPGREFSTDAHELKPGNKALCYIITLENEDGYAVLSMRRADRERIWRTVKDKLDNGEIVTVKIVDANKGGLLVDYSGLEGFIPTSQLGTAHYPKVPEGDRDQIVTQLRELINKNLSVKILSFDQMTNKLIFSEKAAGNVEMVEKAKSLPVGKELVGEVTGVVDFGVFVRIEDIEGLVHISEVSWEKVDDLKDRYKPGDKVNVVVIGVEGSRVSLSIKRLLEDPWKLEVGKMKVGDKIEGEVTRVTAFGAFVRLVDGVDGLVHISELGDKLTDPHEAVTLGEKYTFEILSIEPDTHRISLRLQK